MIEEMQWVRPEEIEARSMAIIEAEMPEGNRGAGCGQALHSHGSRF